MVNQYLIDAPFSKIYVVNFTSSLFSSCGPKYFLPGGREVITSDRCRHINIILKSSKGFCFVFFLESIVVNIGVCTLCQKLAETVTRIVCIKEYERLGVIFSS